jgi:hypothetical protein
VRIKAQPVNIELSSERRRRRAGIWPGYEAAAEWRPDERRFGIPTGDDPGIDATGDHPFLDYDPVIPDWPR